MIICDICKKEEVLENGQPCEKCQRLKITDLAEDRQGITGSYLPADLFEKYTKLLGKANEGDRKAEGLFPIHDHSGHSAFTNKNFIGNRIHNGFSFLGKKGIF